MNEVQKMIKDIEDKLDNSKEIEIQDRKITKEEIEKLGDYEYIMTTHPKGFNIMVRRKYFLDTIFNFPVLMFSCQDEYIVADELFGEHGDFPWTAQEVADYINGLLGYEVEEE